MKNEYNIYSLNDFTHDRLKLHNALTDNLQYEVKYYLLPNGNYNRTIQIFRNGSEFKYPKEPNDDQFTDEEAYAVKYVKRITSNDPKERACVLHSTVGPAIIWSEKFYEVQKDILLRPVHWFVHGIDISDQAETWCNKLNLPHWSQWEANEKALFTLKWL